MHTVVLQSWASCSTAEHSEYTVLRFLGGLCLLQFVSIDNQHRAYMAYVFRPIQRCHANRLNKLRT